MPAGTQFTEDDEFDNGDSSNLVKDLRKQIDKANREKDDLARQLGELSTRERQRTLTEALTAKGLPAKAAKFYPSDAALDDDAVNAWVADHADVFGVTTTQAAPDTTADAVDDTPGEQSSAVDLNTEAAYRRLQSAQLVSGNVTTRESDLLRGMREAKSEAELTAFLRQARA